MLHRLLEREVRVVGGEHVVLGGLSQGCAAALVAGLLWRGEALGAVVGLCGWLPLAGRLMEVLEERSGDGDDDGDGDGISFGGEGEDDNDDSDGGENIEEKGGAIEVDTPALRAIKFLEDDLDFPPPLPPPIPPFLSNKLPSSSPTALSTRKSLSMWVCKDEIVYEHSGQGPNGWRRKAKGIGTRGRCWSD